MNFVYKAYLPDGRTESGQVAAETAADAVRLLAGRGRSAFEVTPSEKGAKGEASRTAKRPPRGRAPLSQSRLFLDLAVLTDAGMTLSQALRALIEGETNASQRAAVETIATAMNNGQSAAGAFALIKDISPEAVALIASGERSSQMPAVMRGLANQMMEQERRLAEFRRALTYPAFLLVLMGAALSVVTFVLVPSLAPIFENSGQPPPFIMQVLGAVGDAASSPTALALGLTLALAGTSLFLRGVRRAAMPHLQRAILAVPVLGKAIHNANSARYLGSLSMLMAGGTPMTEALTLAAASNPLQLMRSELAAIRDRVAAGGRLPTAMQATDLFPPKVISLVAVGDEVNRLPVVLGRASTILNDEANATISRLLAAITPTMTIVLGLVIGGLVVSVMTALLSINDLAMQG